MSHLKQFIRASDRVIQFNQYFLAIAESEHTIHTLDIQKDEILRHWDSLRKAYDSVLEKLESKEEGVDLEGVSSKFYTAYNAHLSCLSKANELVDKLRLESENTQEVNNAQPRQSPYITLPPCDTETFCGDYPSWPTFRDMFSALYKNNPRLTPVEKLCHLLKKTDGEARAILKTCPFTNEGCEMAWGNLVDRYDNKRVLVNAQLKSHFSLKPISKESGSSIKDIQRTINDCIANLSLLEIDTDNWDIIFVYICSTCLPDLTLNLWEQSLNSKTTMPKWTELNEFLTARFHTLESVADIRTTPNPAPYSKPASTHKNSNTRDAKRLNVYHTQKENPKKCELCDDSHPLRFCSTFLRMSIDERYSTVKRQKRCTNCLATSHEYKKCKSKYVCSVCRAKHHSLLHRENTAAASAQNAPVHNNPQVNNPSSSNSNCENSKINPYYSPLKNVATTTAEMTRQSFATHLQSTPSSTIILGTALVNINVVDIRYTVRALVDPASEASFISKPLHRKLALPVRSSQIGIIGLSGSLTATSSHICSVTIGSPIDDNFQIDIDVFFVTKLTGQLAYQPYISLIKTNFGDLQMADFGPNTDAHVDLLLGGDVYPKIIREGVRWDDECLVVAQNTAFGWIVTGKVTSQEPSSHVVSFYNEIALNAQLTRFWELEEIPQVPLTSDEDHYCEQLFQATTHINASGRFVVSLPFKRDFPNQIMLGNSRNIALSQYLRNEARLRKNPELNFNYNKVINEHLMLGHMSEVTPNVSASYYFPHHAVLKPESTTTKLRVVYNASSPSSNGISLNDVLYPGPVLQADLTMLLLKWRQFKYVFNADIEKMYRQILVNPKYGVYQRILHRDISHEEPNDFELKTVTFGVNCAPYLAIRVLRELATQCEPDHPIVADILRNFMYVDDVLWGSKNLSKAITARDDLVEVLKSAGFSLRKWTSNNETLLQDLPPEYLRDSAFLKLSDTSTTKTLGLRWNAGHDYFYFTPLKYPVHNTISKRNVLTVIACLFDPAGWLAPKIIVAKIIMQQIWKDKTDWDESLKPETLSQWHKFLDDYPKIESIKIPRYVDYDSSFMIEYYGFCDASEKAYASTLYIRVETLDGRILSHLLTAKSKVAPVKFVTLPRKELCGAELIARMISSHQSDLKLSSHRLQLWTDSTIVLAWLSKPPYHWNTFVANRVTSIVDKVGNDNWLHVSSHDNPADLSSRGITAQEHNLKVNGRFAQSPGKLKRNFDLSKRMLLNGQN